MTFRWTLLAVMASFFSSCGVANADVAAALNEIQTDTTLHELVASFFSEGVFVLGGTLGWILLALGLLHVAAIIYVNLTDTPDDNTRYGKLYKNVIEPLAGVLIKQKAKQKPLNKL